MEKEIRKKAVERYLKGEHPKSVYTDLGRSKYWFFKWLKRYKTGDAGWYKGMRSRGILVIKCALVTI